MLCFARKLCWGKVELCPVDATRARADKETTSEHVPGVATAHRFTLEPALVCRVDFLSENEASA
eukprot:14794015-Alexandrium_andersonii.AAC.1